MAAAAVEAYLGEVAGSFPSPAGRDVRGLALSSGYLFVLDSNDPGVTYLLNIWNGSIYSSYNVSWSGSNGGLAFSTPYNLWVGNPGNDTVYRCYALDGSIYGSWSAGHDPFGLAPLCTGDGGTGTSYVLGTDSSPSAIFTHRLGDGSVVRSVAIPGASNFDCAYDWRNKLVWLGRGSGVVFGYTASGTAAASFPSPAAGPAGLAYSREILWVACAGNGQVYRVRCPYNFAGLEPASLGRVRAIFK